MGGEYTEQIQALKSEETNRKTQGVVPYQSRHSRKGSPLRTSSRKETLNCTWQIDGGSAQTSCRGAQSQGAPTTLWELPPETQVDPVNTGEKPPRAFSRGKGGSHSEIPLQYSSWEIPGTKESGSLQSMGLQEWTQLTTKPPPPYILSFHYYHLIVSIDTCIFKCKFHFCFRP